MQRKAILLAAILFSAPTLAATTRISAFDFGNGTTAITKTTSSLFGLLKTRRSFAFNSAPGSGVLAPVFASINGPSNTLPGLPALITTFVPLGATTGGAVFVSRFVNVVEGALGASELRFTTVQLANGEGMLTTLTQQSVVRALIGGPQGLGNDGSGGTTSPGINTGN